MITDDKNVKLAPDEDGETAKNKTEIKPTVKESTPDEVARDDASEAAEESAHDEESTHDEVGEAAEADGEEAPALTDEDGEADVVSAHNEAMPDEGEAPAPTDEADGEAEDTPAEDTTDESLTDEVISDEGATDGETVTEHADVELTEAIEDTPDEGDEEVVPVESAPEKPRRERKPKENGPRRVDGIFDFIELFVFTLAVVLFISAFFVRHSVVEGDSMLGTLHSGENLLISDFMYEPERGDIIVVEDLSTKLQKPIIKRVIAVGGDRVRITREGVIVNGEALVEEYVFTDGQDYIYDVNPSEALRNNDTLIITAEYYEFVVPEGELFVMGDHRNKSTDSREIGTVDADAVLGRVILRFFPFDKFGTVD